MQSNSAKIEKILTLNVSGKKGVLILKRRYDLMRQSIIDALKDEQSITSSEVLQKVEKALYPTFDGKIGWYYMAVKLDLEARGVIGRTPNKTPQMLYLK